LAKTLEFLKRCVFVFFCKLKAFLILF